jgi:WXG100 family type VII secretion target
MSMDSIMVNYGNGETVLEELTQADQQMQAQLANLIQEIRPLQATWLGISDEEYTAVQNKWNMHMATMQQTLQAAHVCLSEIIVNYAVTDNSLGAQWQDLP